MAQALSDKGRNYFAMEYIDGEDLGSRLENGDRPGVEEALYIVSQAALGLAHAADNGVVHRDVKPGNIMITGNGRVKVTDFGLARPDHGQSITQLGVVVGTRELYLTRGPPRAARQIPARISTASAWCSTNC